MRVLLFGILLLPLYAVAQENAPETPPGRPPFTLKTTPLNLLNPFQQSMDVHADIPIAQRWGIDLGVGVVFNSDTYAPSKGETYRGVKLKPSIKYYTTRSAKHDAYLALALKYNDINNDRYVQVVRQGGQFAEWILQRRHLVTWGLGLRAGGQIYLGSRRRFMIEPFTGLGVRRLRVSLPGFPSDAEELNTQAWFNWERRPPGAYTTPDLMLGFHLGWIIGG